MKFQSLLATKLLVAISIYFKDVDITGKYMKYLDRFDAMEKPMLRSQTEKTLLNVRAKVEELYRKRHEYHRDQMKTFLPQEISGEKISETTDISKKILRMYV